MNPTPAQPAKKAAAPAKKVAAPAFNFAAVTVADGAAPARASSREGAPNPFLDHLRASADKREARTGNAWIGQGKTFTVPEKQAQAATNLIRYAANKLNIGVTIAETAVPGGKVRIDFAAKNRKQKKKGAAATPAA